jgi:hypothetical protein
MQRDTMDPKGKQRRGFMKLVGMGSGYLLMFGAAGLSFLASGCGWATDIEAWVPIATFALSKIQALLGPLATPIITPIFGVITTALNDLLAATQQYSSDTVAADKATALARINTYLADITSNFQNLLNSLPAGGIVDLVVGLVQVILTTIAGFVAKAPAAPAGTTTARRAVMPGQISFHGQTMQIPAIYRNKKKFQQDFDSVCKLAGHPEAEI